MLLGIAGGTVGGWVTSLLLGVNLASGFNLTTILVSIGGAVWSSDLPPLKKIKPRNRFTYSFPKASAGKRGCFLPRSASPPPGGQKQRGCLHSD